MQATKGEAVRVPHAVLIGIMAALCAAAPGVLGGDDALASSAHRGLGYRAALTAKAAADRAEARRVAEAERIEKATAYYSRRYGRAVGRWYPLAHRWFPGHVGDALYVMRGESGGNAKADNGLCRGLWQINECHRVKFLAVTGRPYFWGVFDPEANAEMTAYMTRGGRDWTSWSVRP